MIDMKKMILVLASVFVCTVYVNGTDKQQQNVKMDNCIDMVKALQKGNPVTRQKVLYWLQYYKSQWTLLGEISDKNAEGESKDSKLQLNALAYEAAVTKLKKDLGVPQGVFVDGRNPEYDICFVEKSIQPGKEAVYRLTERTGIQLIAIVEMAEGDLTVVVEGKKLESDNCVFKAESRNQNIEIRLRNNRNTMVSFVIINEHK